MVEFSTVKNSCKTRAIGLNLLPMQTRKVFIAAAAIALNLVLGKVAAMASLPVYLDSVGTILAAALIGWAAVGVGIGTSLLAGFIINPFYPPYAGTQATIAVLAVCLCRLGAFKRWWTAILAGYAIALVAVVVSAPVTVLLFGGVTQSGTTGINALLIAAGANIWKSVLGGSFLIESFDKPAAAATAFLVIRRLPTFPFGDRRYSQPSQPSR